MKGYIETKRLILRNFRIEDAKSMHESYFSDSEVTKYVTWYPHANFQQTLNSLSNRIIPNIESDKILELAITKKENTDNVIGNAVANFYENEAEIGYVLGKKYWNQGYMSEIVPAFIDYLFENTSISKIVAYYDLDNPASGKVMRKSRMTFVKNIQDKRKYDSDKNDLVTCACYQITRVDWHKFKS